MQLKQVKSHKQNKIQNIKEYSRLGHDPLSNYVAELAEKIANLS